MADGEPKEERPSDPRSQRRKLEMERVQLEVNKLKRSVWWQPGVIVPVVAAILGVVAAWATGWFDFRRQMVALDTERMTLERDALQKQVADLDETLVRSQCTVGLARWESEFLQNLNFSRPDPRHAIRSFLDDWRASGSKDDVLAYYEQRAMMKGGFGNDYDGIVSEGSGTLAMRPVVEAETELHVHDLRKDAIGWSFIGKLSAGHPPVFIFVLAWVRTPASIAAELERSPKFPDLLAAGAKVEVKSPFAAFHSPRTSQDEDVYAIGRIVDRDTTLQEALVARGLAVYFRGDANAPYELHRRLLAAQEKAATDRAGFWGANPKAMQELADVESRFVPR